MILKYISSLCKLALTYITILETRTMSSYTSTLSDIAGLTIATLYTLAGQAHFTSKLTPGLAANIDVMTPNSYNAFGFGTDYHTFKQVLGACDLLAAVLLWRKKTRKAGLVAAVVGFSGGLYGQWYSGGDLGQVGGLLCLAIVGLLLAA